MFGAVEREQVVPYSVSFPPLSGVGEASERGCASLTLDAMNYGRGARGAIGVVQNVLGWAGQPLDGEYVQDVVGKNEIQVLNNIVTFYM